MNRTLRAALLLLLAPGCGGVVAEDQRDAAAVDSGADTAPVRDGDAPVSACTYPNGAFNCREGCPYPPDCNVCFLFRSKDPGKLAPFGGCYSGTSALKTFGSAFGPDACSVCPGGEDFVCARMISDDPPSEPHLLRCVSPTVCDALASVGLVSDCYWQDKTPWTPGATIPAATCPPGGATGGLCGGECGACPSGQLCAGRSPTHPLGVCVTPNSGSIGESWCHRDSGCRDSTNACFVVHNPNPVDQALADEYGVCIPIDRCKSARALLPGGGSCTDKSGAELP